MSDEDGLSEAATRENTPTLQADHGKPLPHLPSLLPGPPAGAPSTAEWSMADTVLLSDAAVQLAAVRARAMELEALTALACVSQRPCEECPVCFASYEEGCYPSARAAGAFECGHSICFGCSHRLLVTAAAAGPSRSLSVYRCPLCRADGCLDREDVPTPVWLRGQLASQEVIDAREAAAKEEEEQAPLRLRLAASSASEQIAARMPHTEP